MDNKKIKLEDIGNRKPFVTPDNYFTNFSSRIDNLIEVKKVKPHVVMKPWMYMAAMFTGILILGSIISGVYTNKASSNTDNYELYMLSQLDEDVMYDYYMKDNNINEVKPTENQIENPLE